MLIVELEKSLRNKIIFAGGAYTYVNVAAQLARMALEVIYITQSEKCTVANEN